MFYLLILIKKRHDGKSCEEFSDWMKRNDEDLQNWEKWAKDNNARQCPKCGVWIIRPTGCNQVFVTFFFLDFFGFLF